MQRPVERPELSVEFSGKRQVRGVIGAMTAEFQRDPDGCGHVVEPMQRDRDIRDTRPRARKPVNGKLTLRGRSRQAVCNFVAEQIRGMERNGAMFTQVRLHGVRARIVRRESDEQIGVDDGVQRAAR